MQTQPTSSRVQNPSDPLFSVQTLEEQNKSLARRFVERINARDIEGAFALAAAGWIDHAATPGSPAGVAGGKALFTMLAAAFPDLQTTIEDLIAEGDKVVARLHVTGTNRGSLLGMPATGKSVVISVIDIHRIVDGKFVEHWSNSDDLGMMQQLGLIPPPALPVSQAWVE